MSNTKPNFLHNLNQIIEDTIYIGSSKDDLETELRNNTWFISATREQVKTLSRQHFLRFIDEVVENRKGQIQSAHANHGMIFYLWFDEQACQIRFSLISDFSERLPFKSHIQFVETPDVIIGEFLSSEYHDGISYDELSVRDVDPKEIALEDKQITYTTKVFMIHLE